jgi:carbamate kinase
MTATPGDGHGGPPVIAFGGNALLPDADRPDAASENAAAFAEALMMLIPADTGIVLVHGNGPQVGRGLLRAEAASPEIEADPLDVLVAETQGSIGYLLSRSIGDALRRRGRAIDVATVITQVVVDPEDPAMKAPTKPVGPFYEPGRAASLAAERGWSVVEVPGRGHRRVVPSPLPLEVMEIDAIERASMTGTLVIAGGGGGIPVERRDDGSTRGVEAVIDKDRTAALIAGVMDARRLVILTDIGHVSTGFGTPDEAPLLELTADEAERHLEAGEFPPGSMGPKVESCIAYARATGNTALITSVAALTAALAGGDGTRIVP